jgi:transposase
MARPLVSDELWAAIAPLLPKEPPKPKGGRPRVPDRAALTGILFVLMTGMPWEMLPQEMGCGSGMTCWRRLHDWHKAGVWAELHAVLLDQLAEADRLDWSRAAVDSASVPAPLAPKAEGDTSDSPQTDVPQKGAKRPGRLQRIAANRARSATWW